MRLRLLGSSGWKGPRPHFGTGVRASALGRSRRARGRWRRTPGRKCSRVARREVPWSVRAGVRVAIRGLARSTRLVRPGRTLGARCPRSADQTVAGRELGGGRGNVHSWTCSGLISMGRGLRASRSARAPWTEGVPHPWSAGPFTRALFRNGPGVWPLVSAAKARRDRAPGMPEVVSARHEAERKRRLRGSAGDRSGQRAVKRAAHARSVGSGPRGRRGEIRVLFEKLGTLVLARRISLHRPPAGAQREAPRVPATHGRWPCTVRSRDAVRGATSEIEFDSDAARRWATTARAKGRDAPGRWLAPSLIATGRARAPGSRVNGFLREAAAARTVVEW